MWAGNGVINDVDNDNNKMVYDGKDYCETTFK